MSIDKTDLISLLGVMAVVVGVLWGVLVSYSKREQERLKRCEELHEEAQKHLIDLTGESREMKGRMHSVETLGNSLVDKLDKIESLTHNVLEEVKSNKEDE